jgi:hypothetical protein
LVCFVPVMGVYGASPTVTEVVVSCVFRAPLHFSVQLVVKPKITST